MTDADEWKRLPHFDMPFTIAALETAKIDDFDGDCPNCGCQTVPYVAADGLFLLSTALCQMCGTVVCLDSVELTDQSANAEE